MSNASNPARKAALKQSIIEISGAMLQIEAHKEHIKAIISNLHEEFEMDKATINQIARAYHKQNLNETISKSETLEEEYESIFGPSPE